MIWFKNVTWFVWKIRDHLIGQEAFLPTYIAENHRNRSIGKPCEDNLCFFRCLALQNGCHTKNLKRDTVKQPAVKWTKWKIKRSEHTSLQPRTYSEPRGRQRRKYTRDCRHTPLSHTPPLHQLALLEPLREPFIVYQRSRPVL